MADGLEAIEKQPMTLRSHLLVLTLGTLLPMMIFAVITAALVVRRESAVLERGASERTLALITAVDAELSGHIASLELLATSRNLSRGRLKAFYDEVLRTLPTQPYWRRVTLSSTSGEVVFNSTFPFGSSLPPIRDQSSFARAVRSDAPVIGNLMETPAGWEFAIRRAVTNAGGSSVTYVLSAAIDPKTILDLLTTQRLSPDWVGVVLDATDRIVARTMSSHAMLGQMASDSLRAALSRSAEGWFHGSTLEGREVYTPYNRSPVTGWTVALGIPAEVVQAGESRAMWIVAFGIFIAVGLAVVLASALSRRILEPISDLATAARALGRGAVFKPASSVAVREVQEVTRALSDAAAAVRDREEELRRADRAKDEFLAMLSHELRNPLSALSASAQVLTLSPGADQQTGQMVDIIRRQVDHMSRLVDDLLDVSRVTTGKISLSRRPIDVAEAVDAAVRAMRAGGRLGQHDVAVDSSSVWVEGDAARIEQIVTNLVGNAVKYTPPGGRIAVRVEHRGEQAVIAIEDNGAGMAADLIPRVFDLFVQADQNIARTSGGLGVGLTLVKRLTELHGGRVTASSKGIGQGSCFAVFLPAIEEPRAVEGTPETATGASGVVSGNS